MIKALGIASVLLLLGALALGATVTQPASTGAATRDVVTLQPNGDTWALIVITNAQGAEVNRRTVRIPLDCSAALDEKGANIGTPPAGLCTALANLRTQMDTVITSAAAAHKFDPMP